MTQNKLYAIFKVYDLIIFDICLIHETITTIKVANISINPKVSGVPFNSSLLSLNPVQEINNMVFGFCFVLFFTIDQQTLSTVYINGLHSMYLFSWFLLLSIIIWRFSHVLLFLLWLGPSLPAEMTSFWKAKRRWFSVHGSRRIWDRMLSQYRH